MSMLPDGTTALEIVDRIAIVVHTDRNPTDKDWQAMCDTLAEGVSQRSITGIFVLAEKDGTPNAGQRKRATALWETLPMPPMAVVVGSSMMRAVATAFNLFFPSPAKAFAPDKIKEALDHVGAAGSTEVEAAVQRLRITVGGGSRG